MAKAELFDLAHLRLQIILQPDLADQVDLRLQEVDVLFGVVENLLEQIARHIVSNCFAMRHAGLDRRLSAVFQAEIARQDLRNVFTED